MKKLWTFGDSFTAGHGCRMFDNITPGSKYYETYKDYVDDSKKIWPEIVASSLKIELNNIGKNGITNEKILDYILFNYQKIKPQDTVIIQTSTSSRFDFPFLKNKSLFGSPKNDMDELYESKSSYTLKTIFTSNIEKEFEDVNPALLTYSNIQENIGNEELILTKKKYETIRNFFLEFVYTGKHYEREIWRLVQIANNLINQGVNVYLINLDILPDYVIKPEFLIKIPHNCLNAFVFKTKNTITFDTNNRIDDNHPSYNGHNEIAKYIIKHIEDTNLHNS